MDVSARSMKLGWERVERDFEGLLASRGYFSGCVPHGMEDACLKEQGRAVVRAAIDSLLSSLQRTDTPLDADTLSLPGIEGHFTRPIERKWLEDVGYAFVDLLDGRSIASRLRPTSCQGSTPYERRTAK